MNTNLYRGKVKATGSWIEGYHVYCKDGNHHYISLTSEAVPQGHVIDCDTHQKLEAFTIGLFLEVLPESVGQCRGKKDKHNKKIYDGDIVKVSGYSNYYALVEYDESCCCYFVVNYEVQIPVPLGDMKSQFLEVVGNIIDNEDLLNVRHRWWKNGR
jgi:uncharacterized phage protein (TIGR01671 family)